MIAYILRRLMLVVPTLFGIMVVNFFIIQAAPGGPVEQMLSQIQGTAVDATERFSGSSSGGETLQKSASDSSGGSGTYRGARGLPRELIERIEKMYGFDKPIGERFVLMMKNYLVFDFGESFFRNKRVVDLIIEKMPVSISLGLWTTLLIYMVSIPLGIAKAVRDGSASTCGPRAIMIGYAIPGFLFALLLIVLFAGGGYFKWFPLRGLVSEDWSCLGPGKALDYFWHMALPIGAMVIGGFATLTLLTKNSFLDEINKQYVLTARAKGLTERRVLYGHVFRNAMLIVIAGFPGAFIGVLFTGRC
jgi:microcin C transport system permease protein